MQTYLNNPQLKADFLAEITKHEQQDALIKGVYAKMNGMFRGCAIGCSLHSLNVLQGKVGGALLVGTRQHERYEAELGLPTWFAYLEDNIFEHLPDELAMTWPRRLSEAIPVGAVVDDIVLAKILRWVLADAECGVRSATYDETIRGYIDTIVTMLDAEIATGVHASAEQSEAAAWAARAARAARAAGDAWAAWAARAAMDAWDPWDARAARAARAAWAARAAGDARAAWAARAAGDAWAAWDARAAGAARAAMDAMDAMDAPHSEEKADVFFPSLADYVITLMRELPIGEPQ